MAAQLLDPACSLWNGLDRGHARRIGSLFRDRSYDSGAVLIRQGAKTGDAFVINSGKVAVVRSQPGGGEIPLDEAGAGSVIGEIGLLVDMARTANARAVGPVSASLFSSSAFRAACDNLEAPALIVARNVLKIMSDRLRQQTPRVLQEPVDGVIASSDRTASPARNGVSKGPVAFDWRSFVSILPSFRHFGAYDLGQLLDRANPVAQKKGAVVCRADEPVTAANFVLRGAVAATYRQNGATHCLHIMGPGELCGADNLIDGQPPQVDYVAREDSVILRLPIGDFAELLARDDTLGLAVIKSTAVSLSRGFQRSNNTLGNLRRLARARGPVTP